MGEDHLQQPCRVPVFIVIVLDVWFPILTAWELPVRKCRTQLQRVGGTPRVDELVDELGWYHRGELNADLQSVNSS